MSAQIPCCPMPADLTRRPTTDPTSILRYRDGLYAVDLLTCAITEFDFFTWLEEHPSAADEISAHFGFSPRPLDVMLTLFAASGYIIRGDDEVYRLTTVGREHLSGRSPWSLAPYYASLRDRPVARDFVEVLRSGRPAQWSGHDGTEADWHGAMQDENFARDFTAAMNCRGTYLGKALSDQLGSHLDQRRHVLDIGGGSGIYACVLVANHPELRATVIDQPPVDELARQTIEEHGLWDRLEVSSANMFDCELSRDADVHLYSNVIHDWDVPQVEALIRRSFDALPEKGLLVVHEAFLNEAKDGPLPVAEYSCILAHSTQGRCYSRREMIDWLEAAGFCGAEFRETAADRGFVAAVKP